jgi:integrase
MQDGCGQWLFRYERLGKQYYLSFGPQRTVTIETARCAALAARQDLQEGRDPRATREAARIAAEIEASKRESFDTFRERFIENQTGTWANAASKDQWTNSLKTYCSPVFGHLPVRDIGTALVVKVLEPIWHSKPVAAERLRGRIERVLSAATVAELREGPNPARLKGHLDQILPTGRKKGRKTGHHPATPYTQMGEFMVDLRAREGVAARALEFAILTACRSGDINGQRELNEEKKPMRWRDVDTAKGEWKIPATKVGPSHTVPLSPAAFAVLDKVKGLDSELVFPSPDRPHEPLSSAAMAAVIKRMGRERAKAGLPHYTDPKQNGRIVTVHGFRSTFRDWVSECTAFAKEVAEQALAHGIKDETEAAYRRGDLLAKRARLMAAWAKFLAKPAAAAEGGKIVALR